MGERVSMVWRPHAELSERVNGVLAGRRQVSAETAGISGP